MGLRWTPQGVRWTTWSLNFLILKSFKGNGGFHLHHTLWVLGALSQSFFVYVGGDSGGDGGCSDCDMANRKKLEWKIVSILSNWVYSECCFGWYEEVLKCWQRVFNAGNTLNPITSRNFSTFLDWRYYVSKTMAVGFNIAIDHCKLYIFCGEIKGGSGCEAIE